MGLRFDLVFLTSAFVRGLSSAFTSGNSVPPAPLPVPVPVPLPLASPRPRRRLSPPEPDLLEIVSHFEKGFGYYGKVLKGALRLF